MGGVDAWAEKNFSYITEFISTATEITEKILFNRKILRSKRNPTARQSVREVM